jgi:tetratricopeptide (TPR) repeat protein
MMTQTGQFAAREERSSLLETGRHLVALDEIVIEIGRRPREAYLRLLASDACERLGALPEAADHLSTVLMAEPEHLEANRRLVRLLCELGDADGAIRCWRRVLAATAEEDAETLANLGLALVAARREPEALTALARALELDPQSAGAHCGLGLTHFEHERWKEAAVAFRATERLAPESAVGPFNLGLALERLGDEDEARRALLRAAALEPHDTELQAALEPLLVRPAAASGVVGAPEATPSIRGALESFDLLDVLEFLRVQEKTGSLVVSAPPGVGMLRLERGMLIGGSAPRLRRLGEVLVRRGLISRTQLELAHTRDQQRGAASADGREPDATSVAAALLREGLVEEGRLREVLSRMTLHIIRQLIQWREGVFAFHPSPDTGFPVRFNVQHVVLELMRIEDEQRQRTEHS